MDVPARFGELIARAALLLAPLASASQALATPTRQASQEADFPAYVWRVQHPDAALPEALVEAFGGVNVEGPELAEWTRERGLDFYVGHAPGRDVLHIDDRNEWYAQLWQEYWDQRDASKLIRRACLSREHVREQLAKQLRRSLAARGGDYGDGISLGDEVGLTRFGQPLDLCASVECRAAFTEFVRRSGRWKHLLEAASGAVPYPDTDRTRLAWIEGDTTLVASWMARREFHHGVVLDVLSDLASRAHELAPEAPVGLLGLAGRTAFGGVAVEQILPHVDFLESYTALDTRELLYTLRDAQQQSWLTIYPEPGQAAGAGWQLREHWLRGGDAVVIWSDRDLIESASYLADTRQALAEVRRLRRQLPNWRPSPAGLAIVNDPESTAMSWMRDALHDGPTWPKRFASYHEAHGTREVRLRAWLRLAEDNGLLPGALPFEQVGAQTVERFGVLVLNELVVLESAELQRLLAFVEAGGTLLLSGGFDRWSLAGEPSQLDALARLRACSAEHVLEFELDGERYLSDRTRLPSTYARHASSALIQALERAAVERISWTPRSSKGGHRWLRAQVAGDAPGELVCAALPNLTSAELRAQLQALEVRLVGLEGYELEWLAPRQPAQDGRVALNPGEALVFIARPVE